MPEFSKILSIDFETFWSDEYTLSKTTTQEYIRDPRFETIGVSIFDYDALPDESAFVQADAEGVDLIAELPKKWLEPDEFEVMARHTDWSRIAVVAHHAHFDGLVLSEHYNVRPAFWFDTLSMARREIGRKVGASLKAALEYYDLGRKGTYVDEMKGLRRAQISRDRWLKYGRYGAGDAVGTARLLRRLADVFAPDQLLHIDKVVRCFTEPMFVVDEPLLREYQAHEQERRAKLLEALGVDASVFRSDAKFAALLESLGVDVPMKASKTVKDENGEPVMTYAFAKSDTGMQELLESLDEVIAAVAETRVAMKSTQGPTRTARLLEAGKGGRAVPLYYTYGNTQTDRLGGGDKMNAQNFEKEKFLAGKPVPMTGVIRKSLRAPAGRAVVVVDESQIEPRITAWFWGEDWMTEAFAAGRDVYSENASTLYNRLVDRKKNPADKIPGFIGKCMTLGLNYGMWAIMLGVQMQRGMLGGDPVTFDQSFVDAMRVPVDKYLTKYFIDRVDQTPSRLTGAAKYTHFAVANHVVDTYRGRIKKVVAGWGYLDDVVLPAMANGDEIAFGVNGVLKTRRHGLVLPDGMTMYYSGLERHVDKRGKVSWTYMKSRAERVFLHGSKLCENIKQCLANRVTVWHKNRICEFAEENGLDWPVRGETHDELIFLPPASEAKLMRDCAVEIMSTTPDWAAGCPLAAEGDIGATYGDAK